MRKSRNRILKMKWLVWGYIAASIGILGSCRNKQVQVDIPQLVKTAPVNGHDGMTSVTYPGKIQAASNVKLAFRVAGPIRKIYVNEGQYVKKDNYWPNWIPGIIRFNLMLLRPNIPR